jgi:hypothetical protein
MPTMDLTTAVQRLHAPDVLSRMRACERLAASGQEPNDRGAAVTAVPMLLLGPPGAGLGVRARGVDWTVVGHIVATRSVAPLRRTLAARTNDGS